MSGTNQKRLTPNKKKFLRHYLATCVDGDLTRGSVTEAARAAGVDTRTGRRYMERDDAGELVDQTVADYLEHLRSDKSADVIPFAPRPYERPARDEVAAEVVYNERMTFDERIRVMQDELFRHFLDPTLETHLRDRYALSIVTLEEKRQRLAEISGEQPIEQAEKALKRALGLLG